MMREQKNPQTVGTFGNKYRQNFFNHARCLMHIIKYQRGSGRQCRKQCPCKMAGITCPVGTCVDFDGRQIRTTPRGRVFGHRQKVKKSSGLDVITIKLHPQQGGFLLRQKTGGER